MLDRTLKLLVCVGLLLTIVSNVAKVQAAEEVVSKIVFNGESYDGKEIPSLFLPITEAIKEASPKATFAVKDGKVLLVGLKSKEVGDVSIVWKSNCEVNSQFDFQQNLPLADQGLKNLLVAWTKVHHPGFEKSEIESYRQTAKEAEVILRRPKATGRVAQR